MPSDYLSYWKPSTAEAVLGGDDSLLAHAASEQYGRLARGDTVWVVTAWPGGRLILLGRIVVDDVTDRATAARRLGTDDLWDATHHIVAADGSAEPVREVDLVDVAGALRFQSDRDRLDVVDGRVDAKQLQRMRRLTPASARLLGQRWGEDAAYGDALASVRERHDNGGAGIGPAERNREVERAAVDHVTGRLRAEGWAVRSVEADHIGDDLACTRGGARRHVEVKGVRGHLPSFIITEAELRRAEADPDFWLCVVTDALGPTPVLHEFAATAALHAYEFVPLAHRAMPVDRP